MRVLLILTSGYPIGSVNTSRAHNLAKGLKAAGAEVKVLICHPTETQKSLVNTSHSGDHEGILYEYIGARIVRNSNIIKRKLIDYLGYCQVLLYLIKKSKEINKVIVIGPSVDFRILIPFIAKLVNINSFIEINEYPFVGVSNSRIALFKRWFFSHLVLPNYNGTIVISENLVEYAYRHIGRENAVIKIPIITESGKRSNQLSNRPFSIPYILHAGSLLEQKDGILGMLRAFGIAREKYNLNAMFVFTGSKEDSPHIKEIEDTINSFNLHDCILFLGFIEQMELIRYLEHASVAIIYKGDNIQNRYCFATKITEYVKHSVPLIITNVGESSNYFINGFNSWVLLAGDLKCLAETMVYAITNPEVGKRQAANASELLAEKFNRDYHGERLFHYLSASS